MTDVPRIRVEEARRRVTAGEAVLVCAYDDEEKCGRFPLEGALTPRQLESRLDSIPKDRPLIFYCA